MPLAGEAGKARGVGRSESQETCPGAICSPVFEGGTGQVAPSLFIVGGARGKGIVYEKTNIIGTATMTQASVGAQVGGQTFAELIFFDTPAALKDFKESKFEMRAEASAIAAAEGAAATAKYKEGVAVFTLPKKGLMVQASIGGQKFKFEPEALEPTGRPPKEK